MKTIYTFVCDNCDFLLESLQEIKNYKQLKKCPQCKKNKLYRNYSADLVSGSVKLNDGEITVGHLASRNRSRFSNDQKEDLNREHNKHKIQDISEWLPKGMTQTTKPITQPWYRSDKEKEVSKMTTNEERQKYIETGKI